jgi:hypothetical protein
MPGESIRPRDEKGVILTDLYQEEKAERGNKWFIKNSGEKMINHGYL